MARPASPLRILLLCQGDAETRDSWSGVSRSVVHHLRAAGHQVVARDVEPNGLRRYLLAARTLGFRRRRWWARFHLGREGFRARSRLAARRIRDAGSRVDVILQVGATFEVPPRCRLPVALYCDSNIELARAAAPTGYSEAAALTPGELDEIRAREEEVYRRAGLIFTMSHRLRESFMRDFAIPPERLMTIHCGPNVSPQEVEPRPDGAEGPPTILFVGRDFHRKGGDILLEAFREVRLRIPEARLRIVGGSPRMGGGRGLEGVEFLGYLDRDTAEGWQAMDEAYRTSTVFCLPTRFEPFGTAFVEAMLYGLPCVGPDAFAVPEIIEEGVTGLLVPPGDPRRVAEALAAILADPATASRMGAAGRARALEHFSWEGARVRMTDGLLSLLRGTHPAASAPPQGALEAAGP